MSIAEGIIHVATTIAVLLSIGLFYFIPTIVATNRKDKHECGIFLLNLLLGWTILGWIGALIWSVSDNKKKEYKCQS